MFDTRDLEDFLSSLTVDSRRSDESDIERQINATYKSNDPWTVWTNPPWKDFTRELVKPGHTKKTADGDIATTYTEGALIIRSDVNFWTVALLPRKFETIPVADLVKTIWPHIDQPTLYPDDGNIYWEALNDQDMEVPGEPYELWVEYPFASKTEREQNRLSMYADEAGLSSALTSANRQNAGQATQQAESLVRYHGLVWKDGVRLSFEA